MFISGCFAQAAFLLCAMHALLRTGSLQNYFNYLLHREAKQATWNMTNNSRMVVLYTALFSLPYFQNYFNFYCYAKR